MKKVLKKLVSVMLIMMMMVTVTPVTYASDGSGGEFAFAATDSNGIVIEPCYIKYGPNQTIKEALTSSGHSFNGIEEDWVTSIDGHDDNYNRYYDGGLYDLNKPASSVKTAMIFTTKEYGDTSGILEIVSLMAQHDKKPASVKNFKSVKEAYAAAKNELAVASAERAVVLADNLKEAYSEYDNWSTSDKTRVTVRVIQGETEAEGTVTLTNDMGEEYKMTGKSCTFELLPETYNLKVTNENNEVTGSFTVIGNEKEKAIDAHLPEGEWFGSVKFRNADGADAESNTEGNKTTVYLTDTTYSPYINVHRGTDLPENARLYADYTGFNTGSYYGDEKNNAFAKSWESEKTKLVQVVPSGLEGTSIKLKAVDKYTDNDTEFIQRQYHTVDIVKTPTLKELSVWEGNTLLELKPDFVMGTKEYQVDSVSGNIRIAGKSYIKGKDKLALCGKYSEGYRVEVNGVEQEEDSSVDVSAEDGAVIPVIVKGKNGRSSEYSLKVNRIGFEKVEISKPDKNVSVSLISKTESEIMPTSETDEKAVFDVAPGDYAWVTTLEKYYHASGSITVSKNGNDSLKVEGKMPVKEELLTGLGAFSSSGTNAVEYTAENNEEFNWENHRYKVLVRDLSSSFYVKAAFGKQVTVKRCGYTNYEGNSEAAKALNNETKTLISKFIRRGGRNNSVTIRAEKKAGDTTYYQDYILSTKRCATLDSLVVKDAAENVCTLEQDNEDKIAEFDGDVYGYSMGIGEAAEEIELSVGFSCPDDSVEDVGEYEIKIGDAIYQKSKSDKIVIHNIKLDRSKQEETIRIEVKDENEENTPQTYVVRVVKVPSVAVTFNLTPKTGNVYVIDNMSGREVAMEEDGSYKLMKNFSYTYTATAYGYIGRQKTFEVEESGVIDVDLQEAGKNKSIDATITAEWPYFRADTDNNGAVNAPTPVNTEESTLYWATKVGEGYSGNATGCPIIADGFIYTYSGKKIYKMDSETGAIVAQGDMVGGSSFAINSPTYAEGIIFIGLSNGRIQAFNAKTLESLWIYEDRLGGQPNCQITYENGYIYTGFWNSETKEANFVCLSVTDEDPNKKDEAKLATWVHAGAGYYWAGAFASEKYVLVGTDDGKSGYSDGYGTLLSLDPRTGRVIDKIEDTIRGDIRSSVCYDRETEKYYFTSKDGLFCSIKVNEDGTFRKNSLTSLQLTSMDGSKGMSTSTPVIKNSRAYVGVSGKGQFTMYSGHNITVIDLAGSTPEIAYSVETQGYPQTSGLLTTAYDTGNDKTAYIYFFDNFTPGKLRILKDKPGQTEPDEETLETEVYESSGDEIQVRTAKALFTPYGEQAQYAICSPIIDEWGNMYFKNDSAYVIKIGATIKELKVAKAPEKLTYRSGDKFDPKGMQIVATYSNGKERDVTGYVSFTEEPLTEEDTEIDIIFNLGQSMKMYQNKDGVPGTDFIPPQTSIGISIDIEPEKTLKVEEKSIKVRVKKTSQIHATGYGRITYKTSNSKIATVSSTGLVKGMKTGKTTITVTAAGDEQHPPMTIKVPVNVPTVITSAVLKNKSFKYTGKAIIPDVKNVNKKKLKKGRDYRVEKVGNCTDVGTHKVRIVGTNNYDGSVTLNFKITKAKNTVSAKAAKSKISKDKMVELRASAKGGAKLTYKITSGAKNAKIVYEDNKVFIKGIKKGKSTVTVTAAATKNYNKATKKVTVTVR